MAYIGNTGTTQSFSPAIDYFNGDGSTTAFTLSRTVASAAQVQVIINNVPQAPNTAFTVVGNTVTFTSAPPSGSGNIYVYYTTINSATIAPSQGTVNTTTLSTGGPVWDVNSNLLVNSVKYLSWTTAGRPATPTAGQTGWNSTLGQLEAWNGYVWATVVGQTYSVNYLLVAGGGGAGQGGGGAGGLLSSIATVTIGTAYSIVIGAGGVGGTGGSGNNGSNTTALSLTAIGGGAGGGDNTASGSGGSGGGGGASGSGPYAGGSGTAGQGYAGGTSSTGQGAGGGGAGAVGSATNGGIGVVFPSGSATYYGGGGGGGSRGGSSTSGGAGGGGGGVGSGNGTAGTANTGGGGGGGAGYPSYGTGGTGGSGIVIISYAGAQRGTGGTVTSNGITTTHTFTTSGTFTA